MPEWSIWVIIAVVLGIGEIISLGFVLGPLAIAALLTAGAAALGAGLAVQLLVMLVASLISLLALRPIARRHVKMPSELRTGTAALVGRTATVTADIDVDSGQVRLDGELWTARPLDEHERLEIGERVYVAEIRGATAVVHR